MPEVCLQTVQKHRNLTHLVYCSPFPECAAMTDVEKVAGAKDEPVFYAEGFSMEGWRRDKIKRKSFYLETATQCAGGHEGSEGSRRS